MKLVAGIGLALLVHLTLGWIWTIMAGVGMGLWVGKRGWLLGGLAVGLSWGGLIAYSVWVDPAAAQRMFDVVGGIFGGLPGLAVPVATLLIGVLLGISGGLVGTSLRSLRK